MDAGCTAGCRFCTAPCEGRSGGDQRKPGRHPPPDPSAPPRHDRAVGHTRAAPPSGCPCPPCPCRPISRCIPQASTTRRRRGGGGSLCGMETTREIKAHIDRCSAITNNGNSLTPTSRTALAHKCQVDLKSPACLLTHQGPLRFCLCFAIGLRSLSVDFVPQEPQWRWIGSIRCWVNVVRSPNCAFYYAIPRSTFTVRFAPSISASCGH